MKNTLEAYMPQLLRHEGGYSDHPRDPGGATNMGITQRTLSAWRGHPVTKADVRTLGLVEATAIYKKNYWNKTTVQGADYLPAGIDSMLFDVSVNSGIGRSAQWYPITAGKSVLEGIKALGAKRRSFFRSLSTFDAFGKGWMRRVNEVEAWSTTWALKAAGSPVQPVIKAEATSSAKIAKRSSGAATASTAGTVVTTQAGTDWTALLAIGVPMLLVTGFLIYRALMHSSRAKAFLGVYNNE